MEKISMDTIKTLCNNNSIQWTDHIIKRMFQRGVFIKDVKEALNHGEIIEYYSDDYPYPSFLILGLSKVIGPLHVVCGIGEEYLWIITVYKPDNKLWEFDNKTRRRV